MLAVDHLEYILRAYFVPPARIDLFSSWLKRDMKLCTFLLALKFSDADYEKVRTWKTGTSYYCVEPYYIVQEKTPSWAIKNFSEFIFRAPWAFDAHIYERFTLVSVFVSFSLVYTIFAFVCPEFLDSHHRRCRISVSVHKPRTHSQNLHTHVWQWKCLLTRKYYSTMTLERENSFTVLLKEPVGWIFLLHILIVTVVVK